MAGGGLGGGWSIDQTAPSGTITGAGTPTYLPMFTGATTIGNSNVFQLAGKIGIGTVTPSTLLQVAGTITTGIASTTNGSLVFQNSTNANTVTINSGITSASYALTLPTAQGGVSTYLQNDGAGVLSWATVSVPAAWLLVGNAGTTAGVNFVGTTDAQDVVFKRNSSEVMRLYSSSNFVGIGTATPNVRLHVIGDYISQLFLTAKFQGDLPGLTFIDTRASALSRNWNIISGLSTTGALEFDVSSSNGTGAVPNVHIASMFPSGDVAIGQGTDVGNRLAVIGGSNGLSIAGSFPNQLAPQYGLFCEGDAGIGTGSTTPQARLHVIGSGNTSATYAMRIDSSTVNNIFVVRNDGNVGVGTGSPTSKLYVAAGASDGVIINSSGVAAMLTINSATFPTGFTLTNAYNGDWFELQSGALGGTTMFSVAHSGNFQISTVTSAPSANTKFSVLTSGASSASYIMRLVNGGLFNVLSVRDDRVVMFSARDEESKGANVTAANDLTLGYDGNAFTITGNTTINAITTADWQAGSQIVLVFTGTPTVKNNTAGGAGTASILLAGSADFVAANNSVLGLLWDGTNWQETFRKVA